MTRWRVQLSDVNFGSEEQEAVAEVLKSRWLTMGPKTEEFERAFAYLHKTKHAIAVSNGTAALHLAYLGLGITGGDEVILPAMTFVATASAAVASGARPVFADIISASEPTIDPHHIERLITPQTRAIVVVHYAGYACRMGEILRIADEHNIPVVEDCAHAPGVRYGEQYLGGVGKVGCFSFFSNKNMTTGEGGMVTTDDDEIASRIRLLRSHGMSSGTWKRYTGNAVGYEVLDFGWNYRLDEMRAAIGLIQLKKLEQANAQRIMRTGLYRRLLDGEDRFHIAFNDYNGESSCHILPLITAESRGRQEVIDALTQAQVQVSHHYPPTHLFRPYREQFGYKEGALPITESYAARQITLPLYAGMSESDVVFVTDVLRNLNKVRSYEAKQSHLADML